LVPSIQENFDVWNDSYPWARNGDEWDNQAAYCGKPYEEWKQSIVDCLLLPNIQPDMVVLEIAPGHGRWTEEIVQRASQVIVVDLSPQCIEFCKRRLERHHNISYHVNDGMSLKCMNDRSVDFIWSYDAFVHMEQDVIACYLREFARVLKPKATAVIHHPGRRDFALPLSSILKLFGRRGRIAYDWISMGRQATPDGWRSNVSKELIARLARQNHLEVVSQVDSWGAGGQYHVRLFRDCITTLRQPTDGR
jgi:ubiquinone/menaquinone biosynthesis C-methylase UbiE